MRTWNDYKEHVRTVDPEISKDMEEVEALSQIVKAMVEQRNALGLSQRELAALCGLQQSSVARIESFKTVPNLDTLSEAECYSGLRMKMKPQNAPAGTAFAASAGALFCF